MSTITIQELINAGFHFGHRSSKWNPKMKRYIYAKKNLIHIIDLRETVRGLVTACKFLTKLASNGGNVLFVGTKWQAKTIIENEAKRCNMAYMNGRWLGGTLTNFGTIRKRLKYLEEFEELEESGDTSKYSKKLLSALNRKKKKIKKNLDGIRDMNKLPDVLVVIDPKKEHIAVQEANKLGIPTVSLSDTDSDPDLVDVCIPGNDDAIRSIKYFLEKVVDAVVEGKAHAESVANAGEIAKNN
ncbi:MAG: 30S ribosomal protein S2 [Candidatus Anammoxibacter sp.]